MGENGRVCLPHVSDGRDIPVTGRIESDATPNMVTRMATSAVLCAVHSKGVRSARWASFHQWGRMATVVLRSSFVDDFERSDLASWRVDFHGVRKPAAVADSR